MFSQAPRSSPLLSLSPTLAASLVLGTVALSTGCVGFITGDDTSEDEVGESVGTTDEATDTNGTNSTSTTGGEQTTIYDIQGGEIAENTIVTVKNVIVTSPVAVDEESGGGTVFIGEADGGEYSGISLYLWTETVMGTQLQPGDVVDVTGEYKEFFDVSQLEIKTAADITVVSSGAALPGPAMVSAAEVGRTSSDAEPWEGVRVQVSDATIAESNDGFGQYLLQGDVLVSYLFTELPDVQVGGSFASITGPLHYTFGEYKLEPTEPGDLAGYTDAPAPDDPTPIYDIQQGMVTENSVVKLEGVVASSGLTWSDSPEGDFFVQEVEGGPYSGIQIHMNDTAGFSVAPGDELTIVGTYSEFFDMSQISIADASAVTTTGSGSAPAPELIADPAAIATDGAMTEQYESVLVQVENVTVTVANPDDPEQFNEFVVTGDLRIDDIFFAIDDWVAPAVGTSFASITGALTYGFSNFKLEPRDPSDLVAE